jgi:3-deoxy-D-manno-octulosonic-acid transferase
MQRAQTTQAERATVAARGGPIIYNGAMSFVRDLAYGLAAVVIGPIVLWRMWRRGKLRTDWRGRFGHADVGPADGRKTLLIHAVSVGEVNAARMLVDALETSHDENLRIVVSTTTDTGTARAKSLYEPRHAVVRYPLDFSWMVRRFLDAVRPDAVLLVELEIWPTFTAACGRGGIPVAVINGRLSERSFANYRRARPLVGGMFRRLAAACVQDEAYAERFGAMGTAPDRLRVTGTMKWDGAELLDAVPGAEELATALGLDRRLPLIVCGSSGPGEEALFVEHLADLRDGDGRPVQLLIAPRKPERFEEAAAAMGNPVRRSQQPDGTQRDVDGRRLFLLDTIGDLRKAYSLADLCVVGRSFCPLYGSDMMEPVALGKPVIIGPNTSDFADTMGKLLAGDGIVQVADGAALAEAAGQLLCTDRGRQLAANGRQVIVRQRGATAKHVELVEQLLDLE